MLPNGMVTRRVSRVSRVFFVPGSRRKRHERTLLTLLTLREADLLSRAGDADESSRRGTRKLR
jgi:hypothetical protein